MNLLNQKCLRFVGRWHVEEQKAVTTAPGAHFYFAFHGTQAILQFETMWLIHPYPHLWISVDEGAWVEVPIDKYLRIQAQSEGNHVVKVVYKSAIEKAHRWYLPLCGCLELVNIEANEGILPEFHQKTISFVGDSITEGVFTDVDYSNGTKYHGRPYQDDVMASYAWLCAKEMNLEPIMMGYGGLGVTRMGQGSVPKASLSYPYCFNGLKIEYDSPDYIVMNFGANDQFDTSENFINHYLEFLDVVMSIHSKSMLILLSPFCGVFPQEMMIIKEKFEKKYNKTIHLIMADTWVPKEPLHPTREGHQIIAKNLVEELKKLGV